MNRNLPRWLKGSHNCFAFKGLTIIKPNHPQASRLHNGSACKPVIGSRIWLSSYLLVEYLSSLRLLPKHRVLEIGCGWGVASTYVKKQFNATVTASDADQQAGDFQQLLSDTNNVNVSFQQQSFTDLASQDLSDIDLIMGADICYSTTTIHDLHTLFDQFARQGGGDIIVADQGRPAFTALVQRLKQNFPLQIIEQSIELPTKICGKILHLRLSS